jgi:WD40 repeat protein
MPAADARGEAARVFISYSLQDGAQAAADLRERLLRENLSVWQDRIALQGDRDWWSQIEEALKSKPLQHLVLVVTPGALASKVVRDEIRLARQEGKTVSPVRGPGLGDFHSLPRWLGHVYDLDLPEHHTTLIRVLQGQSTQSRVAMMAPEPPGDFVARPAEFGALKQQLLDAKGDSVAITAALRGAGGYGKTTLAKALAYDPDVQDAYFDGILWVELGEKPDKLLSMISDLIEILSGARPGLENIIAAAARLGEALGKRRILLVIDDVWRAHDLRPFLQGGSNTTRLITTRNDRELPDQAVRRPVDKMRQGEALLLLSGGLPQDQVASLGAELAALAKRLGEWAQLLKIVNGVLRERVVKHRQPLRVAITSVNQRLTDKGLGDFDAKNEADRTKTIAHTIKVSLDELDRESQQRFGELGVFPEDVDVPLGVVARLWNETAGIDEYATEELLIELGALSLLQELELDRRTLRLHDNVRRFLREQAGDELSGHTQHLVRALRAGGDFAHDPDSRRYYYLYLPHHLHEAGDRDALHRLLLNPCWLQEKLAETGEPQSLVVDCEQYGTSNAHRLIGQTLRLTAGICVRDPEQLMPQLVCRLMGMNEASVDAFVAEARRSVRTPAILTSYPSLTPPGAERIRLEGHADFVSALCGLSDGRLVSGSWDFTIRVWDLKTGVECARLRGHRARVLALCPLHDGRLASGSDDKTIRLWDVKTGVENARLEGHSETVNALYVLPDGRLASGSDDHTIRLWDVATAMERAKLEGHTDAVLALCNMSGGRIASGSRDCTIRIWDAEAGIECGRLETHTDAIEALCELPGGKLAARSSDAIILWDIAATESVRLKDPAGAAVTLSLLQNGWLASGSWDQTICLWDANTASEVGRLGGHANQISALHAHRDGRLASGSWDTTIRIWDLGVVAAHEHLRAHGLATSALCVLPGEVVASGAWDNAICLWDARTGAEVARLDVPFGSVRALCALSDGRLASGFSDGTIRLWDSRNRIESARLKGHESSVQSLCRMPDGRLVSGSDDGTICVWDAGSSAQTRQFQAHKGAVYSLCALSTGLLASGGWDTTIRLWDLDAGTEIARLGGHAHAVMALCALPRGWLASGSHDGKIRLWDTEAAAEGVRLEHALSTVALCLLPDGRLASGSQDKIIRLWDIEGGKQTCHLELDAAVECLAVLPDGRLVAGDEMGRIHWLEIVD